MPGPDVAVPLTADRHLGGRYRLIGPIARGGMAEVWEGYDRTLSRPVAVKVLLSHLATDGVVRERFRREAVTAARLSHPHVVATYDTGIDDGVAYIVMELVRGRTLRHQLIAAAGALPVAVAVAVADQIADALAHAHAHGLVHRDIKPANVLIVAEEAPVPRIKVTDFGIAKAGEAVGVDLTSTGMVLGTPKYLSPEQVEGCEPDARADLYSLGVVLFEMLTGRPPFMGATEMTTALAHVRDQPPVPSSVRPGLPAQVDRVVATLLSKEPAQRYSSAADLRRALALIPVGPVRPGGGLSAFPVPAPQIPAPQLPVPAPQFPVPAPLRGAPPAFPHREGGEVAADAAGGIDTAIAGAVAGPAVVGSPADGGGARRPVAHWSSTGPPAPDREAPGPSAVSGAVPVDDTVTTAPAEGPRQRRRSPGVVVAVIVLAGVVAAALVLLRPSTVTGAAGSAGPPIQVTSASVFVLGGRPADDAAHVGNVIDSNPATVWQTDLYATSHFGGLYPGIGLALHLGDTHPVHQLAVTAVGRGWTAESYVAVALPASTGGVGGWGTPTSSRTATTTTTTFALGGRSGQWILLWLTSTGGPPHRVVIADVAVS